MACWRTAVSAPGLELKLNSQAPRIKKEAINSTRLNFENNICTSSFGELGFYSGRYHQKMRHSVAHLENKV
jgi:hypothetical protein